MPLVVNLKQTDTGLVGRNENTKRFYNDIRKYDVLDREDEVKFFKELSEYRAKAKKAREDDNIELCNLYTEKAEEVRSIIINANQRLCVSAAKNWATTDNLLDYVNEANIDLAEAVDRFDYTKGIKFASYAMWYIKRALNKYCHDVMPIVHRTNNSKTWSIESKIKSDFAQKNERNPSSEELMELVNEKLKNGIKDKADLASIQVTVINDHSSKETDSAAYIDNMEYNNVSACENDFEKQSESEYQKTLVTSLLSTLEPREKKIISMRFGLIEVNGIKKEFQLREVAEEMGLTTERIRQMENEILRKLRKDYGDRIFSLL